MRGSLLLNMGKHVRASVLKKGLADKNVSTQTRSVATLLKYVRQVWVGVDEKEIGSDVESFRARAAKRPFAAPADPSTAVCLRLGTELAFA